MPEPIFTNCGFFLKLKKLTIKRKNLLKDCIKENGGQITFSVNAECTHVVTDDANTLSAVHLKAIQKKQLPIVGVDFIWDSVKENRLLPPLNCEPLKTSENTTGQSPNCCIDTLLTETGTGGPADVKIISVCEEDSFLTVLNGLLDESKSSDSSESSDSRSADELRWFSDNDKDIPYFPEDFEIAKYDVLEKVSAHGEYAVVELQCASQFRDHLFLICTHYSVLDGVQDQKQYAPANTSEEARRAYELCIEHLKKADFELRKDFPHEAEHLASTKLQEMLVEEAINCSTLSEEVGVFVELIWAEALGFLNHLLLKPVTSISLNDVSKAEGILLQTKKALDEGKSPRELTALIEEFYKIIPHKSRLEDNVCKKLLSNKQDLCQLIRDMLNVHETNLFSPNPPSLSKYRALGCKIEALDASSEEFNRVKQQVVQSNFSKCPVEVLQIYNVGRRREMAAFESTLGNIQSLFHTSSPCNFVGILSRGLLLPKVVVEEHGIKRTDSGNLGSGIYFSNSISTSIKYSQPNKIDGTRLLLICDVALGGCLDTYQKDISLTTAPSGYDSMHGIRKTKGSDSAFQDDEFVVYRTSQIKMKYVVKFCLADDEVKEFHPTIQTELEDQAPVLEYPSQREDYEIPSKNMLNDTPAGLLDRSGNPIPLQDIHIKGRIIDFVAQVVVFQTYENTSDSSIEVKYVFPLDDTAAVCGFEAFIKGKHIIGEVKEKEKAHREYREAVMRGDGAYLMDQDAPDVFTVSVGNLPPSTKVLIKITYITELIYEFSSLSFHLPAAVAPWQQEKALKEKTQDTIRKVFVKQIGTKPGGFSLEMSIEMPFKINNISSCTHQLKIKKTDCKAVICTVEDSSLDAAGFAVTIMIGDEHLPRMWVEKHPDKETEACMLVFQPEFAAPFDSPSSCGETIICLDCSNSMAGSEIQQAKQIALCALKFCWHMPRLNVIKFGTNFVQFPFNPENFTMDFTALEEFVLSATPSMGNSDLWKTLHYLSLLYPSKGKRNILLISDGHIQNEGMTLKIVNQNAQHTRIFTCGVGSTANCHMLRSLSQCGAGAFEYFDVKSKHNWERKIEHQATRMRSPGCSAVSIKWQQFDTNAPELTYAPAQIQSLFNNEHLLVYGFISRCTQATLNALIDDQELQTMVSTTELQKTTGTMLHKLAARAFIKDYEQGILHEDQAEHEMKKQQLKSLIIKLSLENSIVTQLTSFVAVEKRDVNEDQGDDTLNVSELVAKEDIDILPYMRYQLSDYHFDTDVNEDQGDDTLNVSELVAKEDINILPYRRYQLSNYLFDTKPCAVVEECFDVTYEHNRQKVSKAGWPSLNSVEEVPAPCYLPVAPSLQEMPLFSFSAQQSPSTFMSGLGSASRGAVSAVPNLFGQGINLEGEHPTPFRDESLLLSSQVFSPQSAATGLFGSAPTPAFKGVCRQRMVLESGPPMPSQKDHSLLFSEQDFLSSQQPTNFSVPVIAGLDPNISVGGRIMSSGPPVQDKYPLSSARPLRLQALARCFSPRAKAARPVVQRAPRLGTPAAADHDTPLPEGRRPLPSPAILFAQQPPPFPSRLHLPVWTPELSEKRSQETLQPRRPFMKAKKKKSVESYFTMPAVQTPLSTVSWPQLCKLQNQDGYWQLTPELGTLLELDVDHLVNVSLTKRGIQSLGPKGKEKLLQLIATLLVLQVIRFKQLEGLTFKSLMKLNDWPPSRAFDAVKKAVEWAKRTHRQFPAICQRLELGKDWDSATKKLLRIEIIGTNTHTPPPFQQ
ncbi:protein mono-ADP-ribosyltransferase PARP4 [Eublepharis macularius]|uniref:Poly [ADP-ribose] polymerase n=1 Tax=Eublepharis macularius TaxID=481883 RepID=A0AA97KUB8_EUBMA|nr:protein mono-ADP-ribosyltransferase PARP4 [Eublepharis macularius]XP_054829758.1 protein mono-ADP-ribosyltransferase PARP4 [Eublepharis macularius]